MDPPSSPLWKPVGNDEAGSWEQKWLDGNTGHSAAKTLNQDGTTMFQLDDVDGMFGPGAFEPQIHLASNGNAFGGLGGLGGLLNSDERETSSLLHILGSDLFHGALDGEGGNDEVIEGDTRGRSRLVGRLDELNGSVYVAPDQTPLSLERKSVLGQAPVTASAFAPGAVAGHVTQNRAAGYSQDAQRRGYLGYDHSAAGRDGEAGARAAVGEHGRPMQGMPDGAHGHWMPEHGAPFNYRGGGRWGGPHGQSAGGPRRGGHWNGPPPYSGMGGRGAGWNVNHARGGGNEAAGVAGGAGWKPSGALPAGRGMEHRSLPHSNFTKGVRQPMQQYQQPHMNGRPDPRQPQVVTVQQVKAPASREVLKADAGKTSGRTEIQLSVSAIAPEAASAKATVHPSTSSAVGDTVQTENAQIDSTAADADILAAEKEAADKAKREAKKKIKKEKLRKVKEDIAQSSAPLQVDTIVDHEHPSRKTSPRLSLTLSEEEDSSVPLAAHDLPAVSIQKSQGMEENLVPEQEPAVAHEKSKGAAAVAKMPNTTQVQGGGGVAAVGVKGAEVGGKTDKDKDKCVKVAPLATRKQKDVPNKKSQQQQKQQQPQQRKARSAVYEGDEEEEVPATSLKSVVQSVKQWAFLLGKPQQRRRGRSKAYKFWITMALRALMVMLAISALTTLIAPNAGRNDSSCRLMVDSVRRVCKDTLGLDCRSLAFKLRSLCYVTESVPGMRLLEMLVLWIAKLGSRMSSVFTRNANTLNKGLIARCRLLPLQHHCSLGGPGHHDRLRWHLDTVLRLLQLEREGSFSNGLCVGEKCGALSMSRWNSGIRRHTGAYSLLCEQQFGEGAEFDGEMCACRKGYVVRGGMCRKVRGGGKGGSDEASVALLEGGGRSKRLGDSGSASAAKCATRAKKKTGKTRKFKDEAGGLGGVRNRGTRHLDALDH